VLGVHDVRRMDVRMAEILTPEPSVVEVEIAVGKLKRFKYLGTAQSLAKLIKAGGETLHFEMHKLVHLPAPPIRFEIAACDFRHSM